MKKTLLVILLLSLLMPASAIDIVVDNTTRSYLIYVPSNLGEHRPLLISCHGMNQDAAYQKNMLQIESIADTAKFVTVFPEGIGKSWELSGNRDLRFVEAIIDKMATQYNIDRNRVYLSGFSMGGMFNSLSGVRLSSPGHGVCIERTVYADGHVSSRLVHY